MKFRNPFVNAMMRAARGAARKTTRTMRRKSIASAVSIIKQTLEQTMPDAVLARQKIDAAATHASVHQPQTEQAGLPGQFVTRSLTNDAGTRPYKLYIPKCYTGQPLPLLVMLHGCKQDPDDFAAGTRMNEIAGKSGCLVAYPGQIDTANAHRCWSWFNAIDQQRDQGEASIIADITRRVIADYNCDAKRVFVAGLSAGGAMAVIMGNRYPELYSAIGVHSGLPYAAARNLPMALMVMRKGAAKTAFSAIDNALPVIVFHGDLDDTVHPHNGQRIVEQSLASSENTARKEHGMAAGGRVYTRAIYEGDDQRPMAELWTLHGIAHAWSGGSADGSYTDGAGPDASTEMMRFFYHASFDDYRKSDQKSGALAEPVK